MFMEAREKSIRTTQAPVWPASHGPRCLAHLFSSREVGVGESLPASAVVFTCFRSCLGPIYRAARCHVGFQGPTIRSGQGRSLPAGCFLTLFQPLTCSGLHALTNTSTHIEHLAQTKRPGPEGV